MLLRIILLVGLFTSQADAFMMALDPNAYVDFKIGGRSSGHEEITRQSMIWARDELANVKIYPIKDDTEEIFGDLNPRTFGTKGTSPNMIIQGNFAMDFEDSPRGMSYPINIVEYWGFPRDVDWGTDLFDWHNNPEGQTLHGLRNYINGNLQTAYQACTEVQGRIMKASIDAVDYWVKGQKAKSAFILGQATHIIQDTFSPAHTKRSGYADGHQIVDLCYYGTAQRDKLRREKPNNTICYHEKVDLRDVIFIRDDWQIEQVEREWQGFDTETVLVSNYSWRLGFVSRDDKEAALKHEARLAKVATARYLYIMAQYIYDTLHFQLEIAPGAMTIDVDYSMLKERLKAGLFEGSLDILQNQAMRNIMPNGVLNCERLPNKDI
jgi:hypothetical protein